jgi:hypothetical protein
MWVGCVVSISGANMDIFTIVSIVCTVREKEGEREDKSGFKYRDRRRRKLPENGQGL